MVIRLMVVVVVVRRLVVLVEGGLVFIFFARGAFGDGSGGFDILQSSLLHFIISPNVFIQFPSINRRRRLPVCMVPVGRLIVLILPVVDGNKSLQEQMIAPVDGVHLIIGEGQVFALAGLRGLAVGFSQVPMVGVCVQAGAHFLLFLVSL